MEGKSQSAEMTRMEKVKGLSSLFKPLFKSVMKFWTTNKDNNAKEEKEDEDIKTTRRQHQQIQDRDILESKKGRESGVASRIARVWEVCSRWWKRNGSDVVGVPAGHVERKGSGEIETIKNRIVETSTCQGMLSFPLLPAEIRHLIILHLFQSRKSTAEKGRELALQALLALSCTCTTMRIQCMRYLFTTLRLTPSYGLTTSSARYLKLPEFLGPKTLGWMDRVVINFTNESFDEETLRFVGACLELLPKRKRETFIKFEGIVAEKSVRGMPLFFGMVMKSLKEKCCDGPIFVDWDKSVYEYLTIEQTPLETGEDNKATNSTLSVLSIFNHSILQFAHLYFPSLQHLEFTMDYDMNTPFLDTLNLWPRTLRSLKLANQCSTYPMSMYQIFEIIKASQETLEKIYIDCLIDCASYLDETPRLVCPNLREFRIDKALLPSRPIVVEERRHIQRFFDAFHETPISVLYMGMKEGQSEWTAESLAYLDGWKMLEEVHLPASKFLENVKVPGKVRLVEYSETEVAWYDSKDKPSVRW